MGKSIKMWIISIIICSIIIIACTIIYFHRPIITYLTIPKLIVPISIVKLLSYFSHDQILLDILSARQHLYDQINSLYSLPVFILYGDLEDQTHLHSYHLTSLAVYYNHQGVIIKVYNNKEIKTVVNLVYDLWYQTNPVGILVRDTIDLQEYYLSYCLSNYIYQTTDIKPVVLMLLGVNAPNIGFQRDEMRYFSEQLRELQEQWENHLLQNSDNNMQELYIFLKSCKKIQKYYNTIQDSYGVFGGVYLYNKNINLDFVFSSAIQSYIPKPKSNRWFINTIGLLGCFFLFYRSYGLLQTHRSFQTIYNPVKNYIQKQTPIIQHSAYNLQFYSRLTGLLFPMYINKINYLQQELILGQSIPPIDSSSTNAFSDEPEDTTLFVNIETQIKQLIHHGKQLNSIKNINKSSKVYQIIYDKILQLFQLYWKNLQNYQLIKTSNKLENALNQLRINCNMDAIQEVYLTIKQIENDCELDNSWWMQKKLGNRLLELIKELGQIKNIGIQLQTYCQNQTEDQLRLLHNQILNNYHELSGVFLTKENNKLQISNSLKNLQKSIMLIYSHPLLQPISTQQSPQMTTNNKIIFWDYNELLRINKNQSVFFALSSQINLMQPSLRNIFMNFAQKQTANNLYIQLLFAQKATKNPTIIEVADNLKQNGAILQQIKDFAYKDLDYNIDFIEPNLRNNSIYVANYIKQNVLDSILTAYTKLNNWEGENLVQFLFNIEAAELPEHIDKILIDWHEFVPIILLTKEYLLHDSELYGFLNYFVNQIQNYNSPHNHLNKFIKFILNLPNYNLKWQPQLLDKSVQRNLFIYSLKKYQTHLNTYGNKLLLKQSINKYQEIYNCFKKVYNKFPFGSFGEARHEDIISLVNTIKKNCQSILDDYGFQTAYPDQYKKLLELQFLADRIMIRNNNIYIECTLYYHLDQYGSPMTHDNYEHNSRLIIEYITTLGDQSYNTDNIMQKMHNIYHPFHLQVQRINPSNDEDNNTHEYDFNYNWGLLSFIRAYEYSRIGNDTIFKLNIPLPQSNDYIITYGKVCNWPNFSIKLDPIEI